MAEPDFHVVPEALRQEAEEIRQTSDHWWGARKAIAEFPMDANALGYYGESIVRKFNYSGTQLMEKLAKGTDTIQSAADGLKTCADHFESVDAEFYRQYGYIDSQLGY